MGRLEIMQGGAAVANAVKNCEPNVIAAYPITPATIIVESLAEFVADGILKAEYINVESEHSAISALIGASSVGARTFSATSSQGLALMHEALFNASGLRLPVVMVVANRALSAPLSIWNDQQDSISQRDSGWIQLYAEDVQEAVDMCVQAYRVAEDPKVLLPAMVCMDGFILTHVYEPVEIPPLEEVRRFLPPFNPKNKLIPECPLSFGMFADPSFYTEFKYLQHTAFMEAKKTIKKVASEFCKSFGRDNYGDLIQEYRTKDAEVVLVSMGSLIGTLKDAVDDLREKGIKVGVLKVRSFRPFPSEEIYNSIKEAKAIAVIEKDISLGLGGALLLEIRSELYSKPKKPITLGFIAGLGGRDIPKPSINRVVEKAFAAAEGRKAKEEVEFLDLRKEMI